MTGTFLCTAGELMIDVGEHCKDGGAFVLPPHFVWFWYGRFGLCLCMPLCAGYQTQGMCNAADYN